MKQFVVGFEWKGDASMIRTALPIDNIQLHGPGFVDIKLLWKELETKWDLLLPYQSNFCLQILNLNLLIFHLLIYTIHIYKVCILE